MHEILKLMLFLFFVRVNTFSNYALPKPISRRKKYKKKKSKTTTTGTTTLGISNTILGAKITKGIDIGSYNPLENSSDFSSKCTKSGWLTRHKREGKGGRHRCDREYPIISYRIHKYNN